MTGVLVGLFVAAYLLGAIPFAVLVTRAKGIDIFKVGSGNPGATNVARALGKKWAALVFLLDVLKGAIPAFASRAFITEPVGPLDAQAVWFAVGAAAIAGHCLSPFLGFRGGKGIATALGAGLGAAPAVALSAFALFLLVFAICRYISLASIVAVVAAVALGAMLPSQSRQLLPVLFLLAAFVVYRHRANIGRLLRGEEPKFSFGEKKAAERPPEPPLPEEEDHKRPNEAQNEEAQNKSR